MNADTHIAPFFAKSIKPVFGLNHLGLRNAAEDLFTNLLPGLNGVTQRIRYYSFYCWITGEYLNTFQGDARTDEAYRLFIRKSEILLALIQAKKDKNVTGIPGITYALDALEKEAGSINLLRCVDRPENDRRTKDTYWANLGGILRQYYSASLKDIALLFPLEKYTYVSLPTREEDELPNGTLLGEDLGKAFRNTIGEKAADLFLTCVQSSTVTSEQLNRMKDILVMKRFGDIGPEREMLIALLNQKDFPANENGERCLRKETIQHFLKYCISDRSVGLRDSEQFPKVLFRKVLDGELHDECALGWFAYHINDRWQYHSSVIFFCLLELLRKDGGWVPMEDITLRLATGIYDSITDRKGITLGEITALIDSGNIDNIDYNNTEQQAADAMISLLRLYCECRAHPEAVRAYRTAFSSRRDFFTFKDELDVELNRPFMDFLKEFILRRIIYRHHTVSLMKYSATHVSSNKFLLEDGYLKFREQTEYSATAPRIDSLIEYLTDLGLLSDMFPTADAIQRYNLA